MDPRAIPGLSSRSSNSLHSIVRLGGRHAERCRFRREDSLTGDREARLAAEDIVQEAVNGGEAGITGPHCIVAGRLQVEVEFADAVVGNRERLRTGIGREIEIVAPGKTVG